jgi:hypothetical protein
MQIAAQVDKQQAVLALIAEEPQQESFASDDSAMHPIGTLCRKDRIVAAKSNQVAVQLKSCCVLLPLGGI